jgi:histidinol-phosphate aminotransferase
LFDPNKLVRENVKRLSAYSSVREESGGSSKIFLDANENSFGSPLSKWYNRYPDPRQKKLRQSISQIKSVASENIFLGNGTEECIDLLFRLFCNPQKDNVIICPPTYEKYEMLAKLNDVEVREALLLEDFQLDLIHLENLVNADTKLIWICSPNDPTGNCLNRNDVEMVLNNFNGLVVIDEAYINFAKQKSFLQELSDYPNLVVLQTFSKAWGLAGLRLGAAFASTEIIEVLNKIKVLHNINEATQQFVLKALEETEQVNEMIVELISMREAMAEVLKQIPIVEKVYPSETNFLLVKFSDTKKLYEFLLTKNIFVRDVSDLPLCENCLRITVGTEKENTGLIDAIADYMNEIK